MREYIMKVIGMAILIGISEQFLPPNIKMRSYVRLFGSLCLLLILIAPLGNVMTAMPDLFKNFEVEASEMSEYEKILEGSIKDTVRAQLSAALIKELGVGEETKIGISFEDGTPLKVKKVIVTVTGKDIFKNPYEMEETVAKRLGCECVVVVG